jgi:hypothetical protein
MLMGEEWQDGQYRGDVYDAGSEYRILLTW